MDDDFARAVRSIVRRGSPYSPRAFFLVRDGLARAVKTAMAGGAPLRHVTGAELSEGIRRVALRRYGPLTLPTLEAWGLHETLDFGRIVFSLIENGVFDSSPSDSLDDFHDVFDFPTAFAKPFLPPPS